MKRLGSSLHPIGTATTPRAREKVLYVEDDDDNWDVAALRLNKHYDLLRARNAAEACEVLATQCKEISVVLMDIQLQGSSIDGVQLTRLIRGDLPAGENPAGLQVPATCARLPIVFVTAYAARYTEPELKRVGGDQLITKPVDFTALNAALTKHYLRRFTRGG